MDYIFQSVCSVFDKSRADFRQRLQFNADVPRVYYLACIESAAAAAVVASAAAVVFPKNSFCLKASNNVQSEIVLPNQLNWWIGIHLAQFECE